MLLAEDEDVVEELSPPSAGEPLGERVHVGSSRRGEDHARAGPPRKFETYHLSVTPKNADAVYGQIDLWVRKDNFVTLKSVMFDKKLSPVKTLVTREIQRHGDRWFITGSRMTDNLTGRSTELNLEKVDRREDIPLETFTVRAIEKG
jgi:hypothetical protein